jgi:hypothetical protein
MSRDISLNEICAARRLSVRRLLIFPATVKTLCAAHSSSFCSTVPAPTPERSSRHPRVIVLRDHKPVVGATIKDLRFVRRSDGEFSEVARPVATTNSEGMATLPRLRPGEHSIYAAADPGYEGELYLKVSRWRIENHWLFRIEISCCVADSPAWYEEQAEAARQRSKESPVEQTMRQFQVRVLDASGAVLDVAQAAICRLGADGSARWTTVHTVKEGQIGADLPAGEYMALFSSLGFGHKWMHFVISGSGSDEKPTIMLRPAAN